jgi:large subunit ribosomal protein L25
MAQVSEIKAYARARAGTGGARATRREAKVPAVVYGEGRSPENVALVSNELVNIIKRGRFLSSLIDLDIDGTRVLVIPREVQLDPVNDKPVHVDFQRVSPGSRIRVDVPVRFINEGASPGLKRGGVLNIVRHEIGSPARSKRSRSASSSAWRAWISAAPCTSRRSRCRKA